MIFLIFQEQDQDHAVCYSGNPKPMEGRFPGESACHCGTEATQGLSGVKSGHVDTYGQRTGLSLVIIGDQR